MTKGINCFFIANAFLLFQHGPIGLRCLQIVFRDWPLMTFVYSVFIIEYVHFVWRQNKTLFPGKGTKVFLYSVSKANYF